MKTMHSNPYLESIRAAYRASPAYKAINEGKPVPGTSGARLPREPGEDSEESAAQDGGSQPVDASIERGSVPLQDAQARQIPDAPDAADLPLGITIDDFERELGERMEP